jgi:putative phosphoesterase
MLAMRIAVLADIHGNLTALEAVLADLQPVHPDGLIVAGDMVIGPNSVEVLHRLQDLHAWMIRGNNEDYLLRFADGAAPEWWHSAHQWAPIRWVYRQMDSQTLPIIRSLPAHCVITRPGKDSIRVVHGSLENSSEHLYPGYGSEALSRDLARIDEPVLVCGHTHIPWRETRDGCLAFNPGSVGVPLNGVTGAQYALMNWKGDCWELEFRLVKYDLSRVRREYEKTGFLEEGGAFAKAFLLEVEHGRNFTLRFLDYAHQQVIHAGLPDGEFIPDEVWDRAAETFDWESDI